MNKDNVKTIVKNSIKVIAFVLVFLMILHALSLTVFSGNNAAQKNKKHADAYTFTDEPDDTLDIIALGSSDMWSGFVPTTLWEEQGYTSVVASYSHQSITQAQRVLEDCRKTQNPKLVIMEIDTVYDGIGPDEINEANYGFFSTLFEDADPEVFQRTVESKFPMFIYHNLWQQSTKKNKRHKYSHGYLFNQTIFEMSENEYMIETDICDYPSSMNILALKDLKSYCDKNDMELLFLEMPSLTSWTYARHNAIQEIADDLDVNLLDLNFAYDDIGMSMTNCFRDAGNHLSYHGAVKTTKFIGKYIKDNYDLQSHKDDPEISAYWNESVDNFYEYYKVKKQ